MQKKVTTRTFIKAKMQNEKLTMLTAYDYPTAKLLDEGKVDALLVGDSLGPVLLGYRDTTEVTMEDMLHHVKAVARGAERAMVVADMPFLSCHTGADEAVRNAGRMIREGKAQAVKIEGAGEMTDIIRRITGAGIPVMGHLGLTPQSVLQLGGYFIQGKTEDEAEKLKKGALSLQEAGVFALVLECVPEALAKEVSELLQIPTIGIGAGPYCDGQILVIHDVLGLTHGHIPSFVKQYATMGEEMVHAVKSYVNEVKEGIFPPSAHQSSPSTTLYGGKG